jgi:FtsP/CotA-like multicopper oxidase with cupredoxin domain
MRIKDFPGRTVYHCHILDHEDRGMMGVVEAG